MTSEAPLVDTTSTQLGAVVNERAVSQLPLNARDTYQLLSCSPACSRQTGSDLFYGSNSAGVVSVNGGRGRSNNFNVNGGDANDLFVNLPAVQPTPDSIRGISCSHQHLRRRVRTQFRRRGQRGHQVGNQQFHGNVYEFFRNKVLNSKGYFDTSKSPIQAEPVRRNLRRAIKKDRTFFFASYEGRRVGQGISSDPLLVPTAAERTGDFSARSVSVGVIAGPDCADQLTPCVETVALPSRTPVARQSPRARVHADIFPGNVIPTCVFGPRRGRSSESVRSLCRIPSRRHLPGRRWHSKDRTDQFTVKFDHRINDKQNL